MEEGLRRFIAVCVALTGFDSVELTGTGIAELYRATLEKWVGPVIAAELLAFGTEPPPDETVVRNGIMSDAKLGPVARNLIALWYTGLWTPLPSEWYLAYQTEIPNPPDITNAETYIPSPESYIQGLVWTAAHTHPMGAKQPGFGTWAQEPDPAPKGGRR
ncbi:MAG TPA: hypothetical protein VGJ82_08980 [Thermoanaerobaculia bacterium]|jgi:hypothetical protein